MGNGRSSLKRRKRLVKEDCPNFSSGPQRRQRQRRLCLLNRFRSVRLPESGMWAEFHARITVPSFFVQGTLLALLIIFKAQLLYTSLRVVFSVALPFDRLWQLS